MCHLSCDATMTSDHDAIMCVCVCGEENGKEVKSKCGKIASSLIVRHTMLGGIGVIQHPSWILKVCSDLLSSSSTREISTQVQLNLVITLLSSVEKLLPCCQYFCGLIFSSMMAVYWSLVKQCEVTQFNMMQTAEFTAYH